jgi:predicted RNA-binding Zn-ribbon protein involved in translation (DUF1610 family)
LFGRGESRLLLAALLVFAMHGAAAAQTLLQKLVIPGPVIQGHVKFEKDCGKCHEPFSRQSQTRLCLDCHKETAADRRSKKGFHGLNPEALKQECRHCHTDHKGRDADINQLDRDTFDHGFTNFKLKDAHKTVPCAGCHLPKVIFRKAPTRCFDCHKSVDPHKRRLGEKCESCHSELKWARVKTYDHSKTKFPLEGAHKKVECATCHVGEMYKDLARTCVSCHRLQDIHSGRYGPKCEACHDQNKWKTVRFDHDKTKYPLRGAHKKVKCDACHTGDVYHEKLQTTCVSCHKSQDPHKNQLGPKCERCHNEDIWRQKAGFDHDLTRFPLIGLHAPVPCENCHQSSTYKKAPLACEKCHKDEHQGRLGSKCASCHNPNGWGRWRFNHTTQTKYPLTGAHEKIVCEACHKARNPANLKLPVDCFNCHRMEDIHRGSFGSVCEKCHVTASWRKLNIRN